jgi:hypothetical protein
VSDFIDRVVHRALGTAPVAARVPSRFAPRPQREPETETVGSAWSIHAVSARHATDMRAPLAPANPVPVPPVSDGARDRAAPDAAPAPRDDAWDDEAAVVPSDAPAVTADAAPDPLVMPVGVSAARASPPTPLTNARLPRRATDEDTQAPRRRDAPPAPPVLPVTPTRSGADEPAVADTGRAGRDDATVAMPDRPARTVITASRAAHDQGAGPGHVPFWDDSMGEAQSGQPPRVHITIGRIEVRAARATAPAPKPAGPRGPRVSLDGYLHKRSSKE